MLAFRSLAVISCLVLTSACTTHKQVRVSKTEDIAINTLAVVVEDKGEFEVQYARLKQDGTSTVLFGLLGYAVESNHRGTIDEEKKQQILNYVEQLDCAGKMTASLLKTLETESPIRASLYSDAADVVGKYDAVVTFDVDSCGFRLVNRDTELFVPFIDLEAHAASSDGYVIWDDKEVFTGSRKASFDTMLDGRGVAAELLEDLLEEAGARLAYQIIYQ